MSAHMKAILCTAVALWCAIPIAPAVAGEVLLGYGASYASGTHRGIDVAAAAGEPVVAAARGTVLFAGTVPADGGGTCIAVTIQTAEGLRVSILPLAKAAVSEGASVAVGDELGTLAATGDDSSSAPHFHLSLRRGESYVDPSGLLAPAPAEQPEVPAAAVAPQPGAPDTPTGGESAAAASAPTLSPGISQTAGTVAASATTPMSVTQPAATPAASAIRPTHARVPVGADVPVPSGLQSDVALGHRRGLLRFAATSPQTSLAAIGVCAIALVGLGATRLRAAETRA